MPLSDTAIRRLKPTTKCKPNQPDKYSDGSGLRLWVRHTGTKVWVTDYKFNGKRQSLTIGKYPAISLAQARLQHQQILEQVDNGIDPKIAKKEQKAKTDGSRLFDTIAQQWHDQRKDTITITTYKRDYSQYLRDIKPHIGHLDISKITPLQILAIGQAIEERGASDMARRAIRQINQIYKYAIIRSLTTHNPATNLTEALKPHKVQHHSRITAQQLPKLLHDIDNYDGDILVKLGLRLMCYTFVRTSELRNMQWQEIDYQAKIWRIPAERMKMNRPHNVPLAPQSLALLEQIKAYGFSDKYVFFNTSSRKPYSQNAFITALWRLGYKGRMTGHGFRGLASTTLHELGFMHEAIELQLAHEPNNKISKAYNGAKHLPYRIDMMTKWADFIDKAFNDKVINTTGNYVNENDI